MEQTQAPTRPRTFRDLGTDARSEAFASLDDELRKPTAMTHLRLSDWVGSSDDRRAFLAGSVWGGIRWPKALGKPKTASITAGFSIAHQSKKTDLVDEGGGHYKDIGTWVVVQSQSVWDATTADSDYRVAFFFFANVGFLYSNRLTVSLTSVAWDMGLIAGPGYLTLDPFRYGDFTSRGERIVFPDYIVRHVPFRRDGKIHPLAPARDTESFKQPAQ